MTEINLSKPQAKISQQGMRWLVEKSSPTLRLSSYAVTGTTHGLQGDQDYTDEADGDFIGSKTKPWQTLVSRILDNTEVHIVPTVNPDGWDRAEEGLCSGQVQVVPKKTHFQNAVWATVHIVYFAQYIFPCNQTSSELF